MRPIHISHTVENLWKLVENRLTGCELFEKACETACRA
jgi:hypothetical protein